MTVKKRFGIAAIIVVITCLVLTSGYLYTATVILNEKYYISDAADIIKADVTSSPFYDTVTVSDKSDIAVLLSCVGKALVNNQLGLNVATAPFEYFIRPLRKLDMKQFEVM